MDKTEWELMDRDEQIQFYIDNPQIGIGKPIEMYKVTMTARYVMWMMALVYLTRTENKDFHHYEEINNMTRTIFNWKKFNLSSYGRLALLPFQLIIPMKDMDDEDNISNKTRKNGYFKLSSRGYKFLAGNLEIPKTVKFWGEKFEVVGGEYINVNNTPKLDFQETIKTFKTF